MSCKFSVGKCLSCNKYNTCLLQAIYTSVLSLNKQMIQLSDEQQNIKQEIQALKNNSVSVDDGIDISSDINEVNKKINFITDVIQESDMDLDELNVDMSQMKTTLLTLDLKVDNILKSVTYSLL